MNQEKPQLASVFHKKNARGIHAELDHLSEIIIHARAKSMDIHITVTFKQWEDCAQHEAKKGGMSMLCSPKFWGKAIL